jgi:hypothetical protein
LSELKLSVKPCGAEIERVRIQNRIISSSVVREMILLFDRDFHQSFKLGFNGFLLLDKSWAPRLRMVPIPPNPSPSSYPHLSMQSILLQVY